MTGGCLDIAALHDEALIERQSATSLRDGAVKPWSTETFGREATALLRFCARHKVPVDVPFAKLKRKQQQLVLEGGDKGYPGIIPWLETMRREMKRGHHRFFTRRFMGDTECRACNGSRLRSEALAVRVQNLDLGQVGRMSVEEALRRLTAVRLNKTAAAAAAWWPCGMS